MLQQKDNVEELGFSAHYVCTLIGSIGVVKNWVAGLMPILQELGSLENGLPLTKQAQLEQPLFN